RQRAVRGSGHIHPHALHLQKGQKLVHAGLCLDLMLIEIRDPVHYPADQLLLRLGEVVVLLAVGDPVPEGEGLQHLAGLRLGLDAKAPQDAGA
ncbi:Phage holin family protein, partial [Dysosmobacter welbionis]